VRRRNLYVDYAGSTIISKVPASLGIKTDDVAELAIDPDKLHIFDKDTEAAIFQK